MSSEGSKPSNKKRILVLIFFVVLLLVLLYFFTYYLSGKNSKVIYQDATRRIYLISRKGYQGRPDREMWNMVHEDMKTGHRVYITGNTPKSFPNKKMAEIVLNTIDQGKKSSFDSVQRVGVTITAAKTDIHSNLISKKSFSDFLPDDKDLKTVFPV